MTPLLPKDEGFRQQHIALLPLFLRRKRRPLLLEELVIRLIYRDL